MQCVAQVFAEEGALEKLEAFASINGAQFYGMPLNADTITLVHVDDNESDNAPSEIAVQGVNDTIKIFTPLEWLRWQLI